MYPTRGDGGNRREGGENRKRVRVKPIDKIMTSYVVDIHEHVPDEGGGREPKEGRAEPQARTA